MEIHHIKQYNIRPVTIIIVISSERPILFYPQSAPKSREKVPVLGMLQAATRGFRTFLLCRPHTTTQSASRLRFEQSCVVVVVVFFKDKT